MTDIGQGAGFFSNTAGPTIDHLISEALAGQTPIASVHMGVSKAKSPADNGTTMHALSHRGHLQPNNAVCSPSAVWQALFGTFVQPKDDREIRLHILDSVKGEVDTLKTRLGPADNMRLDAHLESIAALETKLMTAPPMCQLPPDPMFTNSEMINNEMLAYTHELMSDLICYAFSCDLTRVADRRQQPARQFAGVDEQRFVGWIDSLDPPAADGHRRTRQRISQVSGHPLSAGAAVGQLQLRQPSRAFERQLLGRAAVDPAGVRSGRELHR
jgi:hypothetical protein